MPVTWNLVPMRGRKAQRLQGPPARRVIAAARFERSGLIVEPLLRAAQHAAPGNRRARGRGSESERASRSLWKLVDGSRHDVRYMRVASGGVRQSQGLVSVGGQGLVRGGDMGLVRGAGGAVTSRRSSGAPNRWSSAARPSEAG